MKVLRPQGSPTEKLDALSWGNTNVLDRFGDEVQIQSGFRRTYFATSGPARR
ncbi:hypothetical protein ACVWWN_005967 [Mycobacterium sp. URHB0021]